MRNKEHTIARKASSIAIAGLLTLGGPHKSSESSPPDFKNTKTDSWSLPYQGVHYLHRKQTHPNLDIHALVVDLTAPGVKLRATPHFLKRNTVSDFGEKAGVQAAINADYYNMQTFEPNSLAVGDGKKWPETEDDHRMSTFEFGANSHLKITQGRELVTFNKNMDGVVGGFPYLVRNGDADITASNKEVLCTKKDPRTAIGFSSDKKTFYMAVVDGRRKGSVGMTCMEMAALMKGFGASEALGLDGGGSATMWLKNKGVVNIPAGKGNTEHQGVERVVANHLGLYARSK